MVFLSTHSFAVWDGNVSGLVSQIEVTDGTNYGFRVYLSGNPKLCENDHSWAYLNNSDSNYNTYVAVLLAAKAAKQTVRLYTNRKDQSATGYCHIGFIVVN